MKKLLSLFIAVLFVFSLSPFVLFADEVGSSIDNPHIVSNLNALQEALEGDEYDYVHLDRQIYLTNGITIPSNKTLIVGESDYQPYLLTHGSVFVEADASLIIESGVSLGQGHVISSSGGTIINHGLIVNTVLELTSSECILINESSGVINDRNSILFDSDATIQNHGQIDCYLYYYGSSPNIEGIAADRIGPMLFLDDDISAIPEIDATGDADFPIIIEDSIGLPYDGSLVDYSISEQDEPRFMRLYHITLESDQTLSLQRSGNFSPAMYIAEEYPEGEAENIRFVGQHFAPEPAINGNDDSQMGYYVYVAGYNAYDTGHFTLSIHQPEQTETLDFFNPDAPTSGPGWSWDHDTSTLTLDNFTFSGNQVAILLPASSHIVLAEGSENYIRTNSIAISAPNGDLSISGHGSLTINAGTEGIYFFGNELHISNLTSLRIDAGLLAITGNGNIFIEDCDELIANAGIDPNSAGIVSWGGIISILRSNLWVTGCRHGIVARGGQSGEPAIDIEESYINATTVEQYGRGPITIEGDGEIILEQCMLVYPEEASIMNYEDPQGDHLGQTFSIYERPHAPGILHDIQHAVRSLEISPAYTLDYDANGGTGDSDALSGFYVRDESVIIADESFSLDGYAFAGWNTSADGSGYEYWPGDTFIITENSTLFAQWHAVHDVQFIDWDETVLSDQTILSGDAALEPAIPLRDGYTFEGWDLPFDSITADITISAVYSEIIEEDSDDETTPTDTSDNDEFETDVEEDSDDASTEEESTTSTPRTGETRSRSLFAITCIILGSSLFAIYLLFKRKAALENH